MTDEKIARTPQPEVVANLSRRSLLAGTAGLTFVGALSGQTLAQESGNAAASQKGANMSHGTTSLSGRLYQINPSMHEHNDVAHDPADIPPPITRREPETIRVDLETIELEAHLSTNSTFRFWTFNGRVPGPFIRVRVGDTVECHLKN